MHNSELIHQRLSELASQSTAHHTGFKKVAFSKEQVRSALTQFSYGQLAPGEEVPLHSHETMEEFFYFLSGTGTYHVNDQSINVTPGSFVRIPPGYEHALMNNGNINLEFVYLGVAI